MVTSVPQPHVSRLFGVEKREIAAIIPGVALSILVMLIALPTSDWVGRMVLSVQGIDPAGKASPVSGVLVAIVIGIIIRNALGLLPSFAAGIRFAVTRVLRLGIILVGIKLSVVDVLRLGAWGLPIVALSIVSGLLFIIWMNRVMGQPEKLGILLAAGTSICGVTAIVSTAPAIEAEDRDVAYAVANITIFGLAAMFIYPYLARVLLTSSEQIGLFLGTAVHETSQVVGAAITYAQVYQDERVLQAATVTKLTRNLLLAAAVPLLSLYYIRRENKSEKARLRVRNLFPVFILGFVALAMLRSLGDLTLQNGEAFGIFDAPGWAVFTSRIGDVWGGKYLLGTAMAAVGLGTSFSVFRGVGFKPFFVGFVGAVVVGLVGLAMTLLLGQFVRL